MIALDGLTKRFGSITAVDDLSLSVGRGEVLGFLGPNGSGKTTTMRMVTGFLAPSAGTVTVCGHDVAEATIEAQRRIGYLPEGAPLYSDMSARGFLEFIAQSRGISGEEKTKRIGAAVERVDLDSVLDQPIETLSKGFKRRVGLAQALLHDPDVMILDEPTDGLDPNQKHQVRDLIKDMGHDKAIVISTHILEEVHAVCTRAAIIATGRKVFDGTPEDLEGHSRYHNAVSVRVRSEQVASLRGEIESMTGVASLEVVAGTDGVDTVFVIPEAGRHIIHELSARVSQSSITVEGLHAERGRLDDVFRQLTVGE